MYNTHIEVKYCRKRISCIYNYKVDDSIDVGRCINE